LPSSLPTATLCNYTLIDFETFGDGTGTGTGYIHRDSWSEYGIVITAQADGAFTPGNLTRFMDTSVNNLVDPTFGSPNEECADVTGPGEGAGGVSSNCDGLGKVMIIQHENVAEPIPHFGGGDIVFDFDDEASTVMQLSLFNVLSGGSVTFELLDGTEHEIEIDPMEENEVVNFEELNMAGALSMTVHFNGYGAIASFGVCRDPRKAPTPAPNGFAPPVETMEPTSAPTMSSDQPTTYPTEALCPENVEVLRQVGFTAPPEVPIEVIEQNTTTVTFRVFNSYAQNISRIVTQFNEETGQQECYEQVDVQEEEYTEYTAYCMINVPITIVDIFVSDDSFNSTSDDAVIPVCCEGENDENPKIQMTVKIWCEDQCPTDTQAPSSERRRLMDISLDPDYIESLKEAQKQASNKRGFTIDTPKEAAADDDESTTEGGDAETHFCSAEDYPCGNDPNMVYVCHYSKKDGYQTFCVHEKDSDVMAYYPKDYCGRCSRAE